MVKSLLHIINMAQKLYTSYSKAIFIAAIFHYLQHLYVCKAAPVSSIGDENSSFKASIRDINSHIDNNYIGENVLDHRKDAISNYITSESENHKEVDSNDKLVKVEYAYKETSLLCLFTEKEGIRKIVLRKN